MPPKSSAAAASASSAPSEANLISSEDIKRIFGGKTIPQLASLFGTSPENFQHLISLIANNPSLRSQADFKFLKTTMDLPEPVRHKFFSRNYENAQQELAKAEAASMFDSDSESDSGHGSDSESDSGYGSDEELEARNALLLKEVEDEVSRDERTEESAALSQAASRIDEARKALAGSSSARSRDSAAMPATSPRGNAGGLYQSRPLPRPRSGGAPLQTAAVSGAGAGPAADARARPRSRPINMGQRGAPQGPGGPTGPGGPSDPRFTPGTMPSMADAGTQTADPYPSDAGASYAEPMGTPVQGHSPIDLLNNLHGQMRSYQISPMNIQEYLENQTLSNSSPTDSIAKIPIIQSIIAKARSNPEVWARITHARMEKYFPSNTPTEPSGIRTGEEAASAAGPAAAASAAGGGGSKGGYMSADPTIGTDPKRANFENDAKRLVLEQGFMEGRVPYQKYEGERVAPSNPMLKAVQGKMIADMTAPGAQEGFDEARGYLRDGTNMSLLDSIRPVIEESSQPTIEHINRYMNPYEDRVLQDAKEQTTESFIQDELEPLLEKYSPGMGHYTGKFRDMRNRAFTRFGEKIKALEYQMRNKGFQESLLNARADQERGLHGATLAARARGEDAYNKMRGSYQLADLMGAQTQQEGSKTDRLMGVAQEQQRIDQSMLDARFQDFERQRRYGPAQTERLAAMLNKLPAQGETFTSMPVGAAPPPAASPWTTAGGLALNAGAMLMPRDRDRRAVGGEVGSSTSSLERLQENLKSLQSSPASSTSDRLWDFIGDMGRGISKYGAQNGLMNSLEPAAGYARDKYEDRYEKENKSRQKEILDKVSIMNVLDGMEHRETSDMRANDQIDFNKLKWEQEKEYKEKQLESTNQEKLRKALKEIEDKRLKSIEKLEEREYKKSEKEEERELKRLEKEEERAFKESSTPSIEEKEVRKLTAQSGVKETKKQEALPSIQEALVNAYKIHRETKGKSGDSFFPVFGKTREAQNTLKSASDILAYEIAESKGINSESGIRATRNTLPNALLEYDVNERLFNKLFKKYKIEKGQLDKMASGSSKTTNPNPTQLMRDRDYLLKSLSMKASYNGI